MVVLGLALLDSLLEFQLAIPASAGTFTSLTSLFFPEIYLQLSLQPEWLTANYNHFDEVIVESPN